MVTTNPIKRKMESKNAIKSVSMGKKFKNDATKKLLGYEFQKLVAIWECFEAKANTTIWLECYGDVSNGEISKEVKHHVKKNYITNNSIEIWKTLKNYADEESICQFTELQIHTTSIFKNDTIFKAWNTLDQTEKYDLLKKHKPSPTISKFFKKVMSLERKELESILEKVVIKSAQPNIDEMWKKLLDHSILKLAESKFREQALQKIVGYITKKAIDDKNEWRIEKNQFDADLRDFIVPMLSTKIQFPYITAEEVDEVSENISYGFLEKLKVIKLTDLEIGLAAKEYLRANLSQIEMIKRNPRMESVLTSYDRDVLDHLIGLKINHYRERNEDIESARIAIDKAQKLYSVCRNSTHQPIPNVAETQKYYRDGRIHHHVEEEDFDWECEKDKK